MIFEEDQNSTLQGDSEKMRKTLKKDNTYQYKQF